jgi:SAM-dependent methyltransferase
MKFEVLSQVAATPFPADWYDNASEDHFWIQWRFCALHDLLREQAVPTTMPLVGLDIGCGGGVLQTQIERTTAWIVDGADVNREALARSRGVRGRTMLYNIHDRRPELCERYDFLLLFDVIEHIEEPISFLESATVHLKAGGLVIVNVPAIQQLYSAYDRVAGHFRRYSRSSLTRTLADAGLELRTVRYWGGSLVPLLALRSLLLRLRRRNSDDVIRFGFAPSAPWINSALLAMMRYEMALMRRPRLGTSLMAMAVKPS